MAYEQKNDTGSLFPNAEKKSTNSPDFSGSALINGVECWVAGWKKVSNGGKPFMSLSIKPKAGEWPKAAAKNSDPWEGVPTPSEDDYGANRDAFDL